MAEMCFALKMTHKGRLAFKATVNDCDVQDGECPFYKTPIQHMASNERCYMRIASLPAYQQQAIADKYYRGEMPWRKYDQSGVQGAAEEKSSVPVL